LVTDGDEFGWSDAFVPVPGVPGAWCLTSGPDEFLVQQLTSSSLPHRAWRQSPLGPAVQAWAFLDGGVHHVSGFGGELDNGVRVFGWDTMRWVSYGLRLDPPAGAVPGEDRLPTFDELKAQFHVGDADLQRRADLLSGVQDAAALRQFVQRIFGDRGLSARRRPAHPAAGTWGRLGFTVAAAALLEGRFAPDEAAELAAQRFSALPRDEGDEIAFRLSLQFELRGYDESDAQLLLGGADSSSSPTTCDPSVHDAPTAIEPTLAQELANRYDEEEDFDPDDIDGDTLVSVWWDNDTGMPNWCGGVDLVLLADGSAVMVHRGDSKGGVEPADLPAEDQARADAIASWLAGEYHSGFAALELEPLDPNKTLSPNARAEWDEAIAASNSYTRVSVGALEPVLRAALGRDPVYARVRDAFAEPNSPEGALLLAAIHATGDGGSYTCLESGEWRTSRGSS
jgi:hypothetical protein